MAYSRPTLSNPRITYGDWEHKNTGTSLHVTMPSVFIASPERTLDVWEKQNYILRRKRFKTWYEGDEQYGEWNWDYNQSEET